MGCRLHNKHGNHIPYRQKKMFQNIEPITKRTTYMRSAMSIHRTI